MTVKIVLDPILTAAPSGCSTNIQFYTFVRYVLEDLGRTDVFFYWRVPTWVTDEQFEFYPVHPNIKYVRCDQHTSDRVQEYFRYSADLERDTAFYGELWDADIMITVRSSLVALMKMKMTSPRHKDMPWAKQVWLIEEMPMFEFKGTVPVTDELAQEVQTLAGYLAADRIWIMSYHEIEGIKEAARRYLSASQQRAINCKIRSVVPVQAKNFKFKAKEFFQPYDVRPFCVAFVGRMEKSQAQLDAVNALMVKTWIQKGDKFRMLACTTSRVFKSFDEDLVECGRYPRQQFWDLMEHHTHVLVTLSQEMGFSLSLLEPMMLGTPAIVLKKPYALAMLGPDYPFYVDTVSQAAGMLELFYRNYVGQYQKFIDWSKSYFRPKYEELFDQDLMYPLMVQAIDEYKQNVRETFQQKKAGKAENQIVKLIVEQVQDREEFVLADVIKELKDVGKLEHLAKKLDEDFLRVSSLPWLPTWNEQRMALKHLLGWQDASTEVGHLRRGVA